MCSQGSIDVVHQGNVLGCVKRVTWILNANLRQDTLGFFMASLGQIDLLGFFINPVITWFFNAATV
jgi:hypothetical protein